MGDFGEETGWSCCVRHFSSFVQRLDSLTHDETMLKMIVDKWGSKRIMLGTDYPFPVREDVEKGRKFLTVNNFVF